MFFFQFFSPSPLQLIQVHFEIVVNSLERQQGRFAPLWELRSQAKMRAWALRAPSGASSQVDREPSSLESSSSVAVLIVELRN